MELVVKADIAELVEDDADVMVEKVEIILEDAKLLLGKVELEDAAELV